MEEFKGRFRQLVKDTTRESSDGQKSALRDFYLYLTAHCKEETDAADGYVAYFAKNNDLFSSIEASSYDEVLKFLEDKRGNIERIIGPLQVVEAASGCAPAQAISEDHLDSIQEVRAPIPAREDVLCPEDAVDPSLQVHAGHLRVYADFAYLKCKVGGVSIAPERLRSVCDEFFNQYLSKLWGRQGEGSKKCFLHIVLWLKACLKGGYYTMPATCRSEGDQESCRMLYRALESCRKSGLVVELNDSKGSVGLGHFVVDELRSKMTQEYQAIATKSTYSVDKPVGYSAR
ncbi:hypothetical protein MMH89_04005 [Candidatus Comchoanobacter bicostacola]|uniref:Uncharacterized protein n=1 Tax=Candidatus Comchoanobacter bicostacola TaxID=2919598 RepID=A0ABY5DJ76_9GAMM|nr:hypothetical protein [Candidatus Comchoanobacter bicostacola]UTC24381.1 hypothetical protein MMH89_04005 [Candidatus Comchoanobacter bicostacola]